MKKMFLFLFSLMLMVSINAVAATGAFHEGKINSEVLQTHDCVNTNVIAVNSFESIEAKARVQNDHQYLKVDTPFLKQSMVRNLFLEDYYSENITAITHKSRQSLYLNTTSYSNTYSFIDPGRCTYTSLININKNSNNNLIRHVPNYTC